MSLSFSPRLATADDYPRFARLFPELGVPDPVPSPEAFATRWLPRVVILQDEAGDAVGYSAWNVFGETFHVGNVVTAPEARRRGGGRALLEDLRRRARDAGCRRWYLNVKQANAVAIRLYERCGLAIEQEGWTLSATWASLATLPRAAREIETYAPSTDDDARIAPRFGLDVERIARARERGAVFRALGGAVPLGFAAFDPSFPGVYPIRAARPELARALFDALRPFAKHEHVRVFVEADRALADALRGAGATLDFALYRMSGPLDLLR